MKRIALLCVTGVLIGANLAWSEDDKTDADVPAALNFEMKSIDGEPVKLSKYHGQVVLMVNVASRC